MAILFLPRQIFAAIRRTVFQTRNETGVRLVGEVRGRHYRVRYIIGPGKHAIHGSARYQCDNQYAENRFNELRKSEPRLEFLGEFHTHPEGELRLSSTDLATIRRVLKELPFFIAGIIQRRPFAISPVLFRRSGSVTLDCVLH